MKKKEFCHLGLKKLSNIFKFIFYIIFFIVLPVKLYADQNDKRLNYLFDELVSTENQQAISKLTNQIWNIWHEIDDPKITIIFETGLKMMNLGYLPKAINYFDKVILSKPNFAEAWNKRATAHFIMGNFDLSMKDISTTLQLEPRHFGALDGMALIFIHLNQLENAIEVYDQILKIFPNSIDTKIKKDRILSTTTKST